MQELRKPTLPLPDPLRAAEIPSFTNYSVVVRLPDIARRTLAENAFSAETVNQIQNLIDEIPEGVVRPVNMPLAKYQAEWDSYIRPYVGMNWLQIPWFFAEEYFYVRLLEATGYFQDGIWKMLDPYRQQKQLGLTSSRPAIRMLAERIVGAEQIVNQDGQARGVFRDSLTRLLLTDLWGNQNDLSMWPVQRGSDGKEFSGGSASSGSGRELDALRKHLLADDTPGVLDYIESFLPGTMNVDIVLDNAGYELVTDLVLADFLLVSGHAARVTLHTKCHPVFVSDALSQDVIQTLDYFILDENQTTTQLAIRLRNGLLQDRFMILSHPFWTSPLPAWEMPDCLVETLSDSDLLIFKGDANYRRLLGDRHWQIDTPFDQVVNYFPAGVLALRTLKSEIAVGIRPEVVPTSDPDWMINGQWGLIQCALPPKTSGV